jgi:hypothetical protein
VLWARAAVWSAIRSRRHYPDESNSPAESNDGSGAGLSGASALGTGDVWFGATGAAGGGPGAGCVAVGSDGAAVSGSVAMLAGGAVTLSGVDTTGAGGSRRKSGNGATSRSPGDAAARSLGWPSRSAGSDRA